MARIVSPGVLSFWHPNSSNGFFGLIAPSPSKGDTGRRFVAKPPQPIPASEINRTEQPWQKHARKLAERAKSHLGWNDRRLARKAREADE